MASKGNADGSRLAHRKVIRRLEEEGVYFMSFCRFCLFFTHFMEVKKMHFFKVISPFRYQDGTVRTTWSPIDDISVRAPKIPDSVQHASVAVDLEREVGTGGRCRLSATAAAAAVIDLGNPELVDVVESVQVPSRTL